LKGIEATFMEFFINGIFPHSILPALSILTYGFFLRADEAWQFEVGPYFVGDDLPES